MTRYSIYVILLALCAFRLGATDHFVSLTSPNPAPPYTNWDTAAHAIQDAIDAADPGDTVIVTNGIYNSGGRVVYETLTNRVAITKSLTVQSVNGPTATIIEGHQVPATTNGDDAVRCVYMTNDTVLIGFTLTHGATRATLSGADHVGGGVYCDSATNSMLSNCVIIANSASGFGGGIMNGKLDYCLIASNSAALGRGAFNSIMSHCVVIGNSAAPGSGGGAYGNHGGTVFNGFFSTTLNNCTFANNSGTAASGYALKNCILSGNDVGASESRLLNCTVVSNSIGLQQSFATNSIIYYNTNENCSSDGYLLYCCTTPLPPISTYNHDNIANEPAFLNFLAGDFHLGDSSPCINSASPNDLGLTKDLDDNPRIAGGTVDIGAYEFQSPASKISYAWLQQNGFPIDGSADDADPDGDGMSNWQEWRANTIPLDAASLLQMLVPDINAAGATLSWQSQMNITYFLQRTTDFGVPFVTIQSNIVGQMGATSCTDTNMAGHSSFFYRVGVQ
jgi:hypothetical protein